MFRKSRTLAAICPGRCGGIAAARRGATKAPRSPSSSWTRSPRRYRARASRATPSATTSKLGKYLEGKLGRPVEVVSPSRSPAALKKKTDGKADLVIGKDSVVIPRQARERSSRSRIAALSGKDGKTTHDRPGRRAR